MRDISATKRLLKKGISKEFIRENALGLKLTNEPSHHRLIEDFGNYIKTTHWKGDKTWITYEEVEKEMPITRKPNDKWEFTPNTKKDWLKLILHSAVTAFALFGFVVLVTTILEYFKNG